MISCSTWKWKKKKLKHSCNRLETGLDVLGSVPEMFVWTDPFSFLYAKLYLIEFKNPWLDKNKFARTNIQVAGIVQCSGLIPPQGVIFHTSTWENSLFPINMYFCISVILIRSSLELQSDFVFWLLWPWRIMMQPWNRQWYNILFGSWPFVTGENTFLCYCLLFLLHCGLLNTLFFEYDTDQDGEIFSSCQMICRACAVFPFGTLNREDVLLNLSKTIRLLFHLFF